MWEGEPALRRVVGGPTLTSTHRLCECLGVQGAWGPLRRILGSMLGEHRHTNFELLNLMFRGRRQEGAAWAVGHYVHIVDTILREGGEVTWHRVQAQLTQRWVRGRRGVESPFTLH